MLRSYTKLVGDEDDEDGVLLDDSEIQEAVLSDRSQSYSERLLYSVKASFISSFGIVGGSFMVAAVSPKILSFVLTRAVPSIAAADLGVKTLAASVAIGTYALSSKAGYVVAEGVWDASSVALTFMYRQAVPRHIPAKTREAKDQRLKAF